MSNNFTLDFAELIDEAAHIREAEGDAFGDERCTSVARELKGFASYVRQLKDGHRAILVISGLWQARESNESIGPAFDHALKRFRWADHRSYEGFLIELAGILLCEFNSFHQDGY